VFWVTRAGLDKELISPAVQGLECVWNGHIIDKDTAVCSSVEGDSKALKPFLTSGIPYLKVILK